MSEPRIAFSVNAKSGPKSEPAITNELFLRSYHQQGAYLRVVAMWQQLRVLASADATPAERTSATVVFHGQLGMFLEDSVSILCAWAAWNKHRNLRLANILKQLGVSWKAHVDPSEPHHVAVLRKLGTSTKRVQMNPPSFFSGVQKLSAEEQLRFFGVPWEAKARRTEVPLQRINEWQALPVFTSAVLQFFTDPVGEIVNATHNKLKHGPQMVLMNLREVLEDVRGLTGDPAGHLARSEPHVRILLDGARTQQEKGEERAAPFLLDDPRILTRAFFELVVQVATLLWTISGWLLVSHYGLYDFSHDPAVRRMLAASNKYGSGLRGKKRMVEIAAHPRPSK